MELETIDDSENNLPVEVVAEIKGMTKWMNFTAVLLIILNILAVLGNLSSMAKGVNGQIIISLLSSGIGIYLSFMVIKSSGLFNSFADNHKEEDLIESLKLTKMYWMVSTIMMIVSIIFSLTGNAQ